MAGISANGNPKLSLAFAPAELKSLFQIRALVAQATGLCRPATRRMEGRECCQPMRTGFFCTSVTPFRSAGRRPAQAGRLFYPFFKQALRKVSFASYRKPKLSDCAQRAMPQSCTAVAQISNLLYRGFPIRNPRKIRESANRRRPAEWNSAIQQIGNLRHKFGRSTQPRLRRYDPGRYSID